MRGLILLYFNFFLYEKGFQTSTALQTKNEDKKEQLHFKTLSQQAISRKTSYPWRNIEMPKTPHFKGMGPILNATKWEWAKLQASRGEHVLLKMMLKVIHRSEDFMSHRDQNKWIQKLVDVFVYDEDNIPGMSRINNFTKIDHEAIIQFGIRLPNDDYKDFQPHNLRNENQFSIPTKVVALGLMDENWGWLSTYFLNRTVAWKFILGSGNSGLDTLGKTQRENEGSVVMSRFLDDPNLIALIVNQHHNFTHPKVLSMPLGMVNTASVWQTITNIRAHKKLYPKNMDFFSAGSDWGPRPMVLECIRKKMGNADDLTATMNATFGRVSEEEYLMQLARSRVVLCMSGLGYDTFRLWESLALGAVPVIERGVGLDRTVWKLPVLLVDDFADLTPELVRSAYLEALYRAEQWEYERITHRWWSELILKLAKVGTTEELLRLHPMLPVDLEFTRPFWPFDCEKMGGCGRGTKRVPKQSCAISSDIPLKDYNWFPNG